MKQLTMTVGALAEFKLRRRHRTFLPGTFFRFINFFYLRAVNSDSFHHFFPAGPFEYEESGFFRLEHFIEQFKFGRSQKIKTSQDNFFQ